MSAFTPTIGRFGDVTARGNPLSLWFKQNRVKVWLGFIIVLLVVVGGGGWWYWQSQSIPMPGGTTHEGMVGQPQFLNPLFSSENPVDMELTPLVFRGLLKYNDQQQLTTDLAKNFQRSQDGKTYSIEMGKNYWQDGQPVTSYDAAFTIKLTQDPKYQGSWHKSFTDVDIQTPDSTHLVLTLKDVYAPFGQNLTIGLLPEHILKGKSAQQLLSDPFNLAPIGDGSLKFQAASVNPKTKKIEELEFKPTAGYLDSVVFDFYPDLSKAVTDFKLGKLQSLGNVYNSTISQLELFPGTHSKEWVLDDQSYGLFFNGFSGPAQDLNVRQALAYAVPKSKILQSVFNNHVSQLDGVYSKSNPVWSERAETYSYDVDKAKDTLSNASTHPTKLILIYADKENLKLVAQQVAAAWKALDITTTIEAKDSQQLSEAINNHQGYDVVLLGQRAEPDPDRYVNWHSTQMPPAGLNITGLNNKRVDKALEDGRKALNDQDRKKDYMTFQDYLAKDAPVIWLYQPHYVYVWSSKIHGINAGQYWNEAGRLNDIGQWYTRTQKKK